MPALVASALPALVALGRQLVIALVTAGIWQAIAALIDGVIEDIKQGIQDHFALSDDDARTVVANFVIDTLETTGILVAVLKSRLPVKTADYLGFTTKGWSRRSLSAAGQAKVGTSAASGAALSAGTTAAFDTVASKIAALKGISFAQVKNVTTFVATLVGVPVAVFYAFAQYMDYAAWQNPYQKTMQGLLAKIGISPDSPMPDARSLSSDSWQQIYTTIEALRPLSITMPTTQQTLVYSRSNLADAIDEITAQIRLGGGTASVKNVLAITFPLIHITETGSSAATTPAAAPSTATTSGSATPAATSSSTAQPVNIQIYTGVLASGTLGVPQEFIAQPNAMIETADELKTSAQINLAAFVTALPGRFFYECAIVNSVRTKAGFTQKGQAVKVISGYYKNGSPRYKTLYYKFAVLKIGVTDENGRNVKLATINLGTVDVTAYQPTAVDLATLNSSLTADTFSTSISDIKTVVSPTPPVSTNVVPQQNIVTPSQTVIAGPVVVPPPSNAIVPVATAPAATVPVTASSVPQAAQIQYMPTSINLAPVGGTGALVDPQAIPIGQFVGYSIPDHSTFLYAGQVFERQGSYVIRSPGYPTWAATPIENYRIPLSSAPAVVTTTASKPGSTASTLSEWYAANGQALPSLDQRAIVYQQAGLGPSSSYVGSADQNNKLLGYLKSK